MTKLFHAFSCLRHRGAFVATVPALVHAQSADLVLCDRLAADPDDPDKPADVKGTATVAAADIPTAIKFCKIAAAASRRAMYQLGRAYAANRQMPEAIGAYRKAADKGSTSAMVELGVLYGTGAGVAKDHEPRRANYSSARRRPAIRAASPISLRSRAAAVRRQMPRNARHAFVRLRRPIRRSAISAWLMMADGTGGPQDDVGARALFEKAAAQNHPGALERMGAFHCRKAAAGPKDSSAAKAYYERAAALGNEDAKNALKRIECPYVLKDKRGNLVTNLCF